jgi:hypothetical protein
MRHSSAGSRDSEFTILSAPLLGTGPLSAVAKPLIHSTESTVLNASGNSGMLQK